MWERGGDVSEKEVFKSETDEGEKKTYTDMEIMETLSEEKRSWRNER